MLSVREPGRSPLYRLVARVLIAALVATSIPAPASASVPAEAVSLTKTAFGELIAHTGTDPQPYAFAGEPLDPNSGFQYHRARWLDPRNARFTGMDSFEGLEQDPTSLHRYTYAGADPMNRFDPTGEFSTWFFGMAVHAAIGQHFEATGVDRLSNRSINRILNRRVPYVGRLRPDLTDRMTTEVYEIKPIGPSAAVGIGQVLGYLMILEHFDPQERTWNLGRSYVPPSLIPVGWAVAVVVPPTWTPGLIVYTIANPAEAARLAVGVAASGAAALALAGGYWSGLGMTSTLGIRLVQPALSSSSVQGAVVNQRVAVSTLPFAA